MSPGLFFQVFQVELMDPASRRVARPLLPVSGGDDTAKEDGDDDGGGVSRGREQVRKLDY